MTNGSAVPISMIRFMKNNADVNQTVGSASLR